MRLRAGLQAVKQIDKRIPNLYNNYIRNNKKSFCFREMTPA